jgi:hypothetical protein
MYLDDALPNTEKPTGHWSVTRVVLKSEADTFEDHAFFLFPHFPVLPLPILLVILYNAQAIDPKATQYPVYGIRQQRP